METITQHRVSYFLIFIIGIHFTSPIYCFSFLINKIQSSTLGSKPASQFYEETTRNFLKQCGANTSVPIKMLNPKKYNNFLGLTTLGGIWLNEELLDNQSKAVRIFTCAHEAAHYAISHPLKLGIKQVGIIGVACIPLACINAAYIHALHHDIAKRIGQGPSLLQMIYNGYLMAFANLSFGFITTKAFIDPAIRETTKRIEKEADLKAAELMCQNGSTIMLEKYIKILKETINSGDGDKTDGLHPTKTEEYAYLSEFVETWKTRHNA